MPRHLKLVLLVLAAVVVTGGCSTLDQSAGASTTTWRDPAYTGSGFRKILVIGLSTQQVSDQRGFENLMVSELQSASVVALPGWQFIPADHVPSQDGIRAIVRNMGADAVLLVRSSGFSPQSQFMMVPGVVPIAPVGFGMYEQWYQPMADVNYQMAIIYTTLFDVATEKPVWTYNPPSYSPSTLQQNAVVFANDVVDRLQRNGLIAVR